MVRSRDDTPSMAETNVPLQSNTPKTPDAAIVLPRSARPIAIVVVVLLVVAVVFILTRGAGPTAVAPSAAPSVLVTANPHLPGNATAQEVFAGLGHAGLQVTAHTASAGPPDGAIVRKIFASYLGWPLDVTEYRSAELLRQDETWAAASAPQKGDPPLTIVGGNILIIWGPVNAGRDPVKPDARQSEGLQQLVSALELLLSPIKAKSVVPVVVANPLVDATPAPTAAPSKAPSAAPAKSAKPGKTPRPTPKP
jgi:hypothetical protein